ncbi:DNA/RNA polymerase [Glarea lozoyensis ATCC 20868]|uniref:DNA-directed RNA polymerase n=1 Tax=Glarea lozoyensis (strain ATCC 20868 / MF5171) TaxID=1116229 RepID=S3EAA8_GLAL2|nr:DNA/RNA polymerase [Glarea lozoyensis ATCC 20868]EPE35253.1 DNA/RNA polymerase [Glarea lozoyensis ATCC 20868]
MLVRAARRKVASATLRTQPLFDQLYLPWLCPAHISSSPRILRRCVTTDSPLNRPVTSKRRYSNDGGNGSSRRSMATAMAATVESMNFDDIPFEPSINTRPPPSAHNLTQRYVMGTGFENGRNHQELGGGSYEDLVNSEQKIRSTQIGVSGDITQILSIYHACLTMGKMERAGVILLRVLKKADVGEEAAIQLHTDYIRAYADHVMLNPTHEAMRGIHRWFDLEIRRKDQTCTAEMVAYMLKASLYAADDETGGNKKRLVRRYMNIVEEEAGIEETLSMPFLTDRERNEIMQICPNLNLAQSLWEDLEQDPVTPLEGLSARDDSQQTPSSTSSDVVPEVKPVEQKGQGLDALRQSLSLFSASPSQGLSLGSKTTEEKREIQRQLEEDSVTAAAERWRSESLALKKMGLDSALQTKSIGARMWKWQKALEQHLQKEIDRLEVIEQKEKKTREDEELCIHATFLRTVPTEKLAALTILSTMGLLASQGIDKGLLLGHAIMHISGAIEDESVLERVKRQKRSPLTSRSQIGVYDLKKMVKNRGAGSLSKLLSATDSKHPMAKRASQYSMELPWPTAVRAKVGAYVLSALIDIATMPVPIQNSVTKETMTEMQPALLHSYKYKHGRKYGIIMANEALTQSLKREPVHSLLAKHLPMLVEPDPWMSFAEGGYLIHPTKLIRVKSGNKDQRYYAEAAIAQGDLDRLREGLDVLGKTEWRINRPVFDVMLRAWNTGEAIANFPAESPDLATPPPPPPSASVSEKRRWQRTAKDLHNQRTGLHSKRCFQNFQLEIARALRSESFYFPHNVDFRGRAYPIPPYLNHMGADHCRGLLKFGKGKPLGVAGLRWLRIHLANVYGFDKASLQEREDFSKTHMEEILDSVANPLEGSRWWLNAEDPWQTLAACFELKSALDCEDPTSFVSHLPVHQDGTCNGLQHYAALGGDLWGAQQVNLEPGDRPADVYTAVADLVKESIARDKLEGNEQAAYLDGKITRKTVKTTVMTNVYGVTFTGARDQVRKQLTETYPDLPIKPTMNAITLSSYVARLIFTALGNMFKGAHEIQHWFGECAGRISRSLTLDQMNRLELEMDNYKQCASHKTPRTQSLNRIVEYSHFKSTVIWTTPLNMPVVQPYRNTKSHMVMTALQAINLQEPHRTDTISKRKQLQGFPPNFIHSLDATHMLLSASKCAESGLSFAAVHDSFWTHASDIDQMNLVLRDMFIDIHTEDVIGRLAAEFDVRYKDSWYLSSVHPDTHVARKIREWRTTHPKHIAFKGLGNHVPHVGTHLHELYLERKRIRLLASDVPEEVQQGKAMVTPYTIFAQEAQERDVADDTEIDAIAQLGSTGKDVDPGSDDISEVSSEESQGFQPVAISDTADEISDIQDEESEPPSSPFEIHVQKRAKVKRANAPRKLGPVSVWLPITFPQHPQKGDFDVSRLRDSKYFFS